MSQLCLYFDMLSQPSRTLYTFLKVVGIPFEAHKISITLGEHRSPEYAEINPRKKLPALKDGDFCLSESIAMVRYITDKYSVADHWYPKDLKSRARVDEYLEYQHLGTRLHYSLLFMNDFLAIRTDQTPDEAETTKLETNVKKITHIVQKTFLGSQKFLCGEEISIADIFAAHEMLQLVAVGRDPVEGYPQLAAWLERVSHKLNPHFAETLGDLYSADGKKVPDKYASKY